MNQKHGLKSKNEPDVVEDKAYEMSLWVLLWEKKLSTTASKIKSPFFVHNYFTLMEIKKILDKNLHTVHTPAIEYNLEIVFFL